MPLGASTGLQVTGSVALRDDKDEYYKKKTREQENVA
jgi:hypothetical protein